MNSFETLLNSKYCKSRGYYIKNIVSEDITNDNYLDFAIPFKFGFLGSENGSEYLVDKIRTKFTKLTIHTYGLKSLKVDDIIRIDNDFYGVENFTFRVETKGFNKAFHYYITLK